MAFALDEVVPWGRSFEEYGAMFALEEADLARRILGCADGPASFNAGLTGRGGRVVSIDPLYRYGAEEIAARIEATFVTVMEQTRQNAGEFVWRTIPDVETLGRVRRGAMDAFLADYRAGREAGRYREASLPRLPFGDGAFGLALCSHFLFLYSAQLDLEFHLASIRELCRVAEEVRIFPLLQLGTTPSPHVDPVVGTLRGEGYAAEILPVPYEFQRGGNRMLRLRPPAKKHFRRRPRLL